MRIVQATVSEFDARTGAGQLVRDDGVFLAFEASAFIASGLRLLRPGQRVRAELDENQTVTLVTILTLH